METNTMIDTDAIRTRVEHATPGPWYAINDDDDMCMNVYFVATEPNLYYEEGKPGTYQNIVAITLVQSPRLVCHKAQKWDRDAEFIAAARTDVPLLLDELGRLRAERDAMQTALAEYRDYTRKTHYCTYDAATPEGYCDGPCAICRADQALGRRRY